jgi:predicted membrane protein
MTTTLILLDGTYAERMATAEGTILFVVFILFFAAIAVVFLIAVGKAINQLTGRKRAKTNDESEPSEIHGKYVHHYPSGATEVFPAKKVDGDVYYFANGNWHGVMHTHYERFTPDN